jgi:hypothetical protein
MRTLIHLLLQVISDLRLPLPTSTVHTSMPRIQQFDHEKTESLSQSLSASESSSDRPTQSGVLVCFLLHLALGGRVNHGFWVHFLDQQRVYGQHTHLMIG